MKIGFVLRRMENHLIDWLLRRNWVLKCFLFGAGIPTLLIAGVALCTSPLYLAFMLMGMV